eukprot:gene62191-85048_t
MPALIDGFEEDFICPITYTLMEDPVIISSGISFERYAIVNWLNNNNTCPVTRLDIDGEIIPNINLRNSIQQYKNILAAVTVNDIQAAPTIVIAETVMAYIDGSTNKDIELEANHKYLINFRYANIMPFSFSVVQWTLTGNDGRNISSSRHELRRYNDQALVYLKPKVDATLHIQFICATW